MPEMPIRALVVDDEPLARRLIISALMREGMHCEPATDGVDALHKCKLESYDLIVTDLRMPNKHGHALVVELLTQQFDTRPVIIAHSIIDDPRLTKDLLLRGVDDVVHKPANYASFAAKAKILVHRRRQQETEAGRLPAKIEPADDVSHDESCRSLEAFDRRLSRVEHILPVSNVAVEVLKRVRNSGGDARELAQLIDRDAVLSAELLRLANGGFYNRARRKITDLHEAIARVGTKSIGEICLAVGALGGLTQVVLPWFDKDLARHRSLAACLAAAHVLKLYDGKTADQGVVFSALMYPLGRVVVGTAYGNTYERLLEDCRRTGLSLRARERDVFPRSSSAALAHVLSGWGLPVDMCAPLVHADLEFESLMTLTEPLRTSVKLLKTALVLGEFAVGRWMAWDTLELPTPALLRSLGIRQPGEIIDDVRANLEASPADARGTAAGNPERSSLHGPSKRLAYCQLSTGDFDFLPTLLAAGNCEVRPVSPEARHLGRGVIVNGLDAPPADLAARGGEADHGDWLVLTREDMPRSLIGHAASVCFPCSFGALQVACHGIADAPPAETQFGPVIQCNTAAPGAMPAAHGYSAG